MPKDLFLNIGYCYIEPFSINTPTKNKPNKSLTYPSNQPKSISYTTNQNQKAIGIDTEKMDNYASQQDNDNWCWAASVKMVMRYNGVPNVTQKDIVASIHGYDWYGSDKPIIPNKGGTGPQIAKSMRQLCDKRGCDVSVRQNNYINELGFIKIVKKELKKERPLIICYRTPESSHAVVLTAIVLNHDSTRIQKILVRDPSPTTYSDDNRGRRIYEKKALDDLLRYDLETFFTVHANKHNPNKS